MLTLLFCFFNVSLRFRFGNSASDFAFKNMKAEYIKMIKELYKQGYMIVVLDPSQTANLKREDYTRVWHVMAQSGRDEIRYLTDRYVICESEGVNK